LRGWKFIIDSNTGMIMTRQLSTVGLLANFIVTCCFV